MLSKKIKSSMEACGSFPNPSEVTAAARESQPCNAHLVPTHTLPGVFSVFLPFFSLGQVWITEMLWGQGQGAVAVVPKPPPWQQPGLMDPAHPCTGGRKRA